MQHDEKRLEARAAKQPIADKEVIHMPMKILYPLIKVVEPHFFIEVKESIERDGLYNPLIIVSRSVADWVDDMQRDRTINPPPEHLEEDQSVFRIQCGCNRWYALRELGYGSVDCYIMNTLEDAQQACGYLRKDKRWRQKTNW